MEGARDVPQSLNKVSFLYIPNFAYRLVCAFFYAHTMFMDEEPGLDSTASK